MVKFLSQGSEALYSLFKQLCKGDERFMSFGRLMEETKTDKPNLKRYLLIRKRAGLIGFNPVNDDVRLEDKKVEIEEEKGIKNITDSVKGKLLLADFIYFIDEFEDQEENFDTDKFRNYVREKEEERKRR